jgi:hypothetical protein
MKQLFLVYDFETPNGFLPFFYNKKTLSSYLTKSLSEHIDIKKRFNLHKKIKTVDLTNQMMESDNSIFVIPIIKEINENIELENIISKKLLNYTKKYSCFEILYINE